MEFSQQQYRQDETIAAIATPPGEGGVAIIRISGSGAVSIADKVFSRPVRSFRSHTAHYGSVVDSQGAHIDDALLIPMLGSRSFTGEETVEIHCHGGTLISRRVLDTVIKAGARPALPGEFSFRAFMNGKVDLAQAEAIQELIAAKNEKALDAAENQLRGKLSAKISSFQNNLTDIAAILEAWIDFPEEGLEFASFEELEKALSEVAEQMKALLDTFHDGRIIHEGISLCLAGCPNVGKSSLMNALLDKERAIVSPIPGTTRDLVEDDLRLNGLNFRLTDTAGIRSDAEEIEREGIRRTRAAMSRADLILLVLDISRGVDENDALLLKEVPKDKTIVIWNKSDLPHKAIPDIGMPHISVVSAKTKTGLNGLHKAIDEVLWKHDSPSREEVMITSLRHKKSLSNAIEACNMVREGLMNGVSPEFLSSDMRQCLLELGGIIGTNIGEDILSAIFSKFCIGK